MKKMLFTFCMTYCTLLAAANGFTIQNYHGVNCLVHSVSANETFYQIAQRYYVRPSTLAVVNNIKDVETIAPGTIIYVPLTETNFYTTKGLEGSKFIFRAVYYKVKKEKTLYDVAALFYLNPSSLAEWNSKGEVKTVDQGDRLTVGWVKYEKDLEKAKAPEYIQKEKIVFGNAEERIEAKEFLKNIEQQNQIEKSEALANLTETANAESAKEQKVIEKKTNETVRITEKEAAFLASHNVKKKPNKKGGVLNKVKDLTKKSPRDEDVKKTSAQKRITTKKETIEVKKLPTVKEGLDQPVFDNNKQDDPLYLVNKKQRLTLLNSINGLAAFFYAGGAGAKFYTFTNLAKKGGVIKITNLDNGHYILAEVVGALPEADRRLGYILKISDNAKGILGVSEKSFSTKVNY